LGAADAALGPLVVAPKENGADAGAAVKGPPNGLDVGAAGAGEVPKGLDDGAGADDPPNGFVVDVAPNWIGAGAAEAAGVDAAPPPNIGALGPNENDGGAAAVVAPKLKEGGAGAEPDA
jgi:hypothetical protein